MSSTEPRLTPSEDGDGSSGSSNGTTAQARAVKGKANGNGPGNGAAAKGNGHAVATVTIAKGAESALALVQQQLAQQAAAVQVVTAPPRPVVLPAPVPIPIPVPAPAPPPPVVAPPPAPVEKPPLVTRRREQERERELDEEFWDEPRPRRERPRLDPDTLTRDERRALGRLKARKVRRIVRHVSPWSVFKVSILFYLCLWLILMVAGVVLWRVGQDAGVITNAEKFYAKAAGEKVFEIDGRQVFRAASSAGAILVFSATAFTVLMTILFNLITDLTGGVRLSVLELESARRDLRRGGADRLAARIRRRDNTSTRDDAGETDELDEADVAAGDDDAVPELAKTGAKTGEVGALGAASDGDGAPGELAIEPRTGRQGTRPRALEGPSSPPTP